jgi:ribonuclease-3
MPTNSSNRSKSKHSGLADTPPALEPARKKVLAAFLKTADLRFKRLELLNLSFMHRSVSNEIGRNINNERLEFLGDAVLGSVAAALLYERLAGKPEGDLAKVKSVIVSEDILSGIARELQIDTLLILGRGEENSGGRTKKAILADALEAFIGAIYLDSGYKAVFSFISRFLETEISRVLENGSHQDHKSLLQEFCQMAYRNYPVYSLVNRSGPEHDRIFWIEVKVNGNVYGPGIGRSKKNAEQEAARMALEALRS